jgi:5'-methylthioadenosine phosphorylase
MADVCIGLIGGTGLGAALGAEDGERHEPETPFGKPSGPIITSQWEGVDLAVLPRHGPGHPYNPSSVPYRANIYAHTFYENAAGHIEFSEPFCPVMREWLLETKRRADGDHRVDLLDFVKVHDGGTYVCMEGPAFSTRAESEMHRQWGGDLIGMTAMPEAKLAREAELPYALIGLPTDYDCWRPHDPNLGMQQLLEEIKGNLDAAVTNAVNLIKLALRDVSPLQGQRSPAQDALSLGIWTDKTKIPAEDVQRLEPLWGRYFT